VLRRLREGGEAEGALGQLVFDMFCRDMDRSLRELGVGDFGVPKRMRQVGEAFYGRARAYDDCLTGGGEGALAEALRRNILKDERGADGAESLARYVAAAAVALAKAAPQDVLRRPPFPDPASFASTGDGAAV
jgi:cytochrome b pre-mRNA-processing protein 3